MSDSSAPAMTIVIDADPEVCRLGYGTVEGLQALKDFAAAHMLPIRYQPGIRVGVLIADDQINVYSPTPLLIESPQADETRPNAICLAADSLQAVLNACAAEGEPDVRVLPSEAQIGSDVATPELVDAVLRDLARIPPKPFDLARIERVYSSKIQYVDFEVTGYKLADRQVRVPTDLLVGSDEAIQSRFRNSFSLLESSSSLVVEIQDVDPKTEKPVLKNGQPALVKYSEANIESERKRIYKDFLTAIPGHGQLISKSRRKAFDARIRWFTNRVNSFRDEVKQHLDVAVQESINKLADALMPSLEGRVPDRLLKNMTVECPSTEEIRGALCEELSSAFAVSEQMYQPRVRVVFKDVTYETIKDASFREMLARLFPGIGMAGIDSLFEEHDSAREAARG
jgi:hypothetical protein